MATSLVAALGAILAAVITGGVTHFTGRQSKRAAAQSEARLGSKDTIEGYDRLTTQLSRQVTALDKRLSEVERRLETTNGLLRAAVSYIEALLGFIAHELPQHPELPPVPTDVRDYMQGH
ncbi:MAG: hypothetical protein NVSMB4_14000 [Acidimicrobiales bacterium]